jgi:hypothetical protein
MPLPYVKKTAKKHHISTAKAEKKWNKAKEIAKSQGKSDNYALITGIYKKMIGENLSFTEFLMIDKFIINE